MTLSIPRIVIGNWSVRDGPIPARATSSSTRGLTTSTAARSQLARAWLRLEADPVRSVHFPTTCPTAHQGSLRISPSDGDSSTKTRCFETDQLGIARARVAASARSRGRCLVEKGRIAQLSCEQRNEPWCALVWLMELTGRSTHESFGSGDCLSCLR